MIVRADVHATPPIPIPQATTFSDVLRGATLAMFRERRAERHARVRRYLTAPDALDALMPDLSRLQPGPANDLLRRYRFSEEQMALDNDELRAALVAARILCWIKLHR